jgi:hypothetical protein
MRVDVPPRLTYARNQAGDLCFFSNGKPVGTIKRDDLPQMILAAARELQAVKHGAGNEP